MKNTLIFIFISLLSYVCSDTLKKYDGNVGNENLTSAIQPDNMTQNDPELLDDNDIAMYDTNKLYDGEYSDEISPRFAPTNIPELLFERYKVLTPTEEKDTNLIMETNSSADYTGEYDTYYDDDNNVTSLLNGNVGNENLTSTIEHILEPVLFNVIDATMYDTNEVVANVKYSYKMPPKTEKSSIADLLFERYQVLTPTTEKDTNLIMETNSSDIIPRLIAQSSPDLMFERYKILTPTTEKDTSYTMESNSSDDYTEDEEIYTYYDEEYDDNNNFTSLLSQVLNGEETKGMRMSPEAAASSVDLPGNGTNFPVDDSNNSNSGSFVNSAILVTIINLILTLL